jgi:nitroreductase/FMN reductase (NADPH)/FMN reductase [NAD(P)H]
MDGAELRDTFGYKASTSGFDAWCTAFHNRKYDSGFAREMSRSVAEYLEQYK